MSKKKKSYSAEFKTQVVLEMLREEESAAVIASRYSVSVQTLNQWKKKFLENAALVFDVGGATKEYRETIETLKEENEALAKTLGKTTIERDWAVGKLKSLDLSSKKSLVDSKLKDLSVTRQCQLLGLNRSTLYYRPVPISNHDLQLMRRIDAIYTDISSAYGYRRIHAQLQEEGWSIGHNKVLRLMGVMGIEGQRPRRSKKTSIKNQEHHIYPYLLSAFKNDSGQVIATHPNQIWSGDITYIPVPGGFMYLSAIIDWHSKAILAWRLSNTMDASLVTGVLKEAISQYDTPEIFNSDQGSQYTGKEHTHILKQHGIAISMNGKGRSIDNIAIERFFRTLKYEEVYVKEYENIKALKQGIKHFIGFYNFNRLHSALNYDKPMNVYLPVLQKEA
ncbi:MAG: IS3 family transposase [Sulfurovum sp.]|nr:IS3 family transposase [Sulfurovum sp.]